MTKILEDKDVPDSVYDIYSVVWDIWGDFSK